MMSHEPVSAHDSTHSFPENDGASFGASMGKAMVPPPFSLRASSYGLEGGQFPTQLKERAPTKGNSANGTGGLPGDVQASIYFENAWITALRMQLSLRDFWVEIENGDKVNFIDNLARILEISREFGLTIHEQAAGHETITDMDLVLGEGIVRSVGFLQGVVNRLPVPGIADEGDIPDVVADLIAATIGQYELMGNTIDDTALLNFLSSNIGF